MRLWVTLGVRGDKDVSKTFKRLEAEGEAVEKQLSDIGDGMDASARETETAASRMVKSLTGVERKAKDVDGQDATVDVKQTGAEKVVTALTGVERKRKDLDGQKVTLNTSLEGAGQVTAGLEAIKNRSEDLDRSSITLETSVRGAQGAIAELSKLEGVSTRIDGDKVTLTAEVDGTERGRAALKSLEQAANRIDGDDIRMKAEVVGAASAIGELAELNRSADRVDGREVNIKVDRNSTGALNALGDAITQVATRMRALATVSVAAVIPGLIAVIGAIPAVVTPAVAALFALAGAMGQGLAGAATIGGTAIGGMALGLFGYVGAASAAVAGALGVAEGLEEQQLATQAAGIAVDEARKSLNKAVPRTMEYREAQLDLAEATKKQADAQRELTRLQILSTPAAQRFNATIEAAVIPLTRVQAELGNRVLPAFSRLINLTVNKLPQLTPPLYRMVSGITAVGESFVTATLNSEKFYNVLDFISRSGISAAQIFANLGNIALNALQVLIPPADRLVGHLVRLTEQAARWTGTAEGMRVMSGVVAKMEQRFYELLSVIGNLTVGFYGLFAAFDQAGLVDQVWLGFVRLTRQFREATRAGTESRAALVRWATDVQPILTAMSSFVGTLARQWMRVANAVIRMRDEMGRLVLPQFFKHLEEALVIIGDLLIAAFRNFAPYLGPIIVGLAEVLKYFIALNPVLLQFTRGFARVLEAFRNLDPWMKKAIAGAFSLRLAFAIAAPVILALFSPLTKISGALGLVAARAGAAKAALGVMGGAGLLARLGSLGAILAIGGPVLVGLGLLAGGVVTAYRKNEDFRKSINKVGTRAQEVFSTLGAKIQNEWGPAINTALKGIADLILEIFDLDQAKKDKIKGYGGKAGEALNAGINQELTKEAQKQRNDGSVSAELGKALGQGVAKGVINFFSRDGGGGAGGGGQNLGTRIVKAILMAPLNIGGAVKDFVFGIFSGIKKEVRERGGWGEIGASIRKRIMDGIRRETGYDLVVSRGWLKKGREWAKNLHNGWKSWFKENVENPLVGWWNRQEKGLKKRWREFKTWAGKHWNNFWTGVKGIWNRGGTETAKSDKTWREKVGSKWRSFTTWAKERWDWLWGKVKGSFKDGREKTVAGDKTWREKLGSKWRSFTTWAKERWEWYWRKTKETYTGGQGDTVKSDQTWREKLGSKWRSFTTWAKERWEWYWGKTKEAYAGGQGATVKSDQTWREKLGSKWRSFTTWAKERWEWYWDKTKEAYTGGQGDTVKSDQSWRERLGSKWKSFTKWGGEHWNNFWKNHLKPTFDRMEEGAKNFGDRFKEALRRRFIDGVNAARQQLGNLMHALAHVLNAIGADKLANPLEARGHKLKENIPYARGGVYNADRGGIAGPRRMGIVGEAGQREAIINLEERTPESERAFRIAARSPNARYFRSRQEPPQYVQEHPQMFARGGVWTPGVAGVNREIENKFGVQGSTYPGHGRHGDAATSIDWVMPSGWGVTASGAAKAKGDAIVNHIVSNWKRLSTEYLIWFNKMKESAGGNWFTYGGGGGYGAPVTVSDWHRDHVHYSSTRQWQGAESLTSGGSGGGGFDWMRRIVEGMKRMAAIVGRLPDTGLGKVSEGLGGWGKALLPKIKDYLIDKAKSIWGSSGSGPLPNGKSPSGLTLGEAVDQGGWPKHLQKTAIGVAWEESSANARAQNPSGARGLFQIMPTTAKAVGASYDKLYDPIYNSAAGRKVYDLQGWGAWVAHPPSYDSMQRGNTRITGYDKGGLIPGHKGDPKNLIAHAGEIVLPQGISENFVKFTEWMRELVERIRGIGSSATKGLRQDISSSSREHLPLAVTHNGKVVSGSGKVSSGVINRGSINRPIPSGQNININVTLGDEYAREMSEMNALLEEANSYLKVAPERTGEAASRGVVERARADRTAQNAIRDGQTRRTRIRQLAGGK